MTIKSYPASEQGPLALGERLHDLRFLGSNGNPLSLYDNRLFGWRKVLHVAASPEAAGPGLARFAARLEDFLRLEAHVFGVTAAAAEDNAALALRLGLPFPVLSDPEGALRRAAGQGGDHDPFTLIFDPVLRLDFRLSGQPGEQQADDALERLRALAAAQAPVVVTSQAPALVVPRVLDEDHCRRLIDFWERGQKVEGAVVSDSAGGNTVKRQAKVRTDVVVPDDSPECRELIEVLARRLLPEILKAFHYRVSRIETFRIGCYDAADGGHFAPHRDDVSGLTEYRRYALTLNLNTGDYEGGYLRLPEFGPQLYAPEAGGAVVFSSSLLHLASPVTKGRRFGLFAFFYGEEEEALRQRISAGLAAPQS